MDQFKRPTGQGRVQKSARKNQILTEEKNKSWEKTCSTVESYLGGKRSTEAWRILKNLIKIENGGQYFNPIFIGIWETNFERLLTENRERYLREQEIEFGLNEVGMDKINLDIETTKRQLSF